MADLNFPEAGRRGCRDVTGRCASAPSAPTAAAPSRQGAGSLGDGGPPAQAVLPSGGNGRPARFSLAGTAIDVLVSGRDSGGEYALLRLTIAPGGQTTAEQHDRAVRVVMPLDGPLRIVGRRTCSELGPPDDAVLRPGEPYLVKNVGDEPARMLLIARPPHFEQLVREFFESRASPVADQITDGDRRRLELAAERLGIRFLDAAGFAGLPDGGEAGDEIVYRWLGVSVNEVFHCAEQHLFVARIEAEPGHQTPLHFLDDPICICGVQGSIDVFDAAAGGWTNLAAGQTVTLPGATTYCTRNTGRDPAHFVVISTERTRDIFHRFGMVLRPIAAFSRLDPHR